VFIGAGRDAEQSSDDVVVFGDVVLGEGSGEGGEGFADVGEHAALVVEPGVDRGGGGGERAGADPSSRHGPLILRLIAAGFERIVALKSIVAAGLRIVATAGGGISGVAGE